MTPTRTRALDAAIDLLATEGLRALTHARVDERAGIPRGSASNYFRTRVALRTGVAQRILERELTPVGAALAPASAPELVDALAGLIEIITGPGRDVTTARLILSMEASHDAALRAEPSRGRRRSPPGRKGSSCTASRATTTATRARCSSSW